MINCLATHEHSFRSDLSIEDHSLRNGFLPKDIDPQLFERAATYKYFREKACISHLLQTDDGNINSFINIIFRKGARYSESLREIAEACRTLDHGPVTVISPTLTDTGKKVITVFFQGRKFIKMQRWNPSQDISRLKFLVFSEQPIQWNESAAVVPTHSGIRSQERYSAIAS